MVEAMTAVAAVLGALGSLVAGVGVLVLNGKVDRLSGRLDRLADRADAIKAALQTLMSALIGRGWLSGDFGRRTAAPLRPDAMKPATAKACGALHPEEETA